MTQGSQWRKWDLHFHTQSSYDYENKSVTNQQIIDGLSANNVSVVAITDHHLMDVDRIRELQKLGKEKNITILPGIEFLSETRGSEPVHFIGIFSENAPIEHIWTQLQGRTNIGQIVGEQKKENQVYCKLIETAQIIKELKGIVTIHAGDKSNSIENITNALPHSVAQKLDIAKVVDIFEIGKETDGEEYRKMVIPVLKNTIFKHHPLIICSDNHNILNYSTKQNLWIKAEPTFEGLKQIIFEPEQRVKIQKEEPDFKEDKLIIEEVRFIGSKNIFTPSPIKFNKNLNVIIGGKSSGKSILLYKIAKTLLSDKTLLEKKKIANKYDFFLGDSSFNFEIKTKGGFFQKLHRESNENSIIPEIKYIPQNYLIDLAEPEENKTGNALNKMVRELIIEDSDCKRMYDDFISTVKSNDRKREAIIDIYFDIKEKISSLQSQLKLKTSEKVLQENIQTNSTKVEELNKSTGMSSDDILKYNDLQKQLDDRNLETTRANNDFRKINEFNKEILATLNGISNKKTLLSNSLENDRLKLEFDTFYFDLIGFTQQVSEFVSLFAITEDKWFAKESAISDVFSDIKKRREAIHTTLAPFLKNNEIKEQIETISKSISDDKEALQAIKQLSKEIDDNKAALAAEEEKLFALYEENFKVYSKVLSDLKSRTAKLEDDGLKIQGISKFNFRKFRNTVLDISDKRKPYYNNYRICDEKDSLSSFELTELIADLKRMFVDIVESEVYALKSATKKQAVKIILDDYFFDYWEIEYKNDKLGKMSTGKASFVILMLIIGLSESKAPILIDQPEDNLDNRSITTDLVEYLRNKKLERQIILVTHNANIVVNADAENIIVANQKGQDDTGSSSPYQFDYINGPLENTFSKIKMETDLLKSMGIREHIADIVEGGKEAFKKREEKYGFKTFQ